MRATGVTPAVRIMLMPVCPALQARVGYQPCSSFTSTLFFCIADLASVDPMYQYSLTWFTTLFVSSVRAAAAAPELEDRLRNIREHFTFALYCNVCRRCACPSCN